jgi:hypothetical protein
MKSWVGLKRDEKEAKDPRQRDDELTCAANCSRKRVLNGLQYDEKQRNTRRYGEGVTYRSYVKNSVQ